MKKMRQLESVLNLSHLTWIVCGLGAFFYAYEYILRIAPSVMIPELRQYFDISAQGIGSLVGLYYLIYTPMQLVVGPVLDLYGPRRILFLAVAACVLGNLLFAHTHVLWLAGAGRLLIGFGSSFAFVGALKLGANWLPRRLFAMYAGLVTSLAMVLAICSDFGLTHLVKLIGWRETLLFCTVIGIILIPLVWRFIQDAPPGKRATYTHSEIFKGLLAVIRNQQIWLAGIIACFLYLALSGLGEMWGIAFLHDAFHFSAHEAAVANSMIFLGWLIGGPLFGWLSDSIKNRRIPLIFGSLCAAICITIILYGGISSLVVISLLFLLFGLFTSTELLCFAIGNENAPPHLAATAAAFVNMIIMLGGFVFQPLIGMLLDYAKREEVIQNAARVYTLHDYQLALSVIPIAMLISSVLALLMRDSFIKS